MQYCCTYKELTGSYEHSFKFKLYLRKLAIDALSFQNHTARNQEILSTPRVQFLYIHHIFKDEAENFEKIVQYLAEHYTFISHSEAVRRIVENDIDRAYIAWSSDDGIRNNTIAAEILNRYGASCCFYVNPYSIALKDFEAVKRFCKTRLNMPPVEFLSWDDIDILLKQGHEIGNHTHDHSIVSELTLEEFAENFRTAHDILTQQCGIIRHFAYTYGNIEHFNKAAYDFVFQQGYDSCTSAVRGCHINGLETIANSQLFLRRDQIIGNWPLPHIEYFLIQSVKKADFSNNFLPKSYLAQEK